VAHTLDLSEGQRLALALAVILARQPRLVLLDEPTRGLDYGAEGRPVSIVRELARKRGARCRHRLLASFQHSPGGARHKLSTRTSWRVSDTTSLTRVDLPSLEVTSQL
jgi:ABC-type transport system involved in cytochrome c biogenesis ATPase subunit